MMARPDPRPRAQATAGDVPAGSRIATRVPGADFLDAWAIRSPGVTTGGPPGVLDLYLEGARRNPSWIEACMALRNRVVQPLGLKNLGGLSELALDKPACDYRPGDRVGVFTLIEQGAHEVLLGDSDRHLDVVVSLHRQVLPGLDATLLTVTTVVHLKSRLGWLYMLPVRPMHRVIARAMTTRLAHVCGAR
jgi:hypothetical protein